MNLEFTKAHDTAGALSTSEGKAGGERVKVLPPREPCPLTLALSPGGGEGRVVGRQDFSKLRPPSSDSSIAQNRTAILPLPAGEGRGEGESPVRDQAVPSSKPSSNRVASGMALLGTASGAFSAETQPVATLIAQIQSSDVNVRGPAWQNAATAGSKATGPLAELMTHPDFEVARAAKRALWNIVRHAGRPKAEKERKAVQAELVALLDAVNAAVVRREAIWMLSEIGDASTVQPIARLLGQVELREDARCALERMPGSKAIRALEQAMKSASADFRPALASSLRARGRKVADYQSQKLRPSRETSVEAKS